MRNKLLPVFSIFIVLMFFLPILNVAQIHIELESGVVTAGINDARIPGDAGDLFSLKTDLISKTQPYFRMRTGFEVMPRHCISLLYAPLQFSSTGSLSYNLLFNEMIFSAGSELKAIYKFNSYRFTYRYDFVSKEKFEFGLGLTGKIRDAKISVSNEDGMSEMIDLGFVPLINFRFYYKPGSDIGILFEGDALGVKQGRAEDVALAVTYKFSDLITIKAGYRILEGGANTNKVYTMALFHYAVIGMSFSL